MRFDVNFERTSADENRINAFGNFGDIRFDEPAVDPALAALAGAR